MIAPTRDRFVTLLLAWGLTAAMAVLLGRVAQLQLAPSWRLVPFLSDRTSARPELALRGDLLDRRGRPIAVSATGARLFADPARFPQPYDESLLRLCSTVGLDVNATGARLFRALENNSRRTAQGERPLRYVRLSGILSDTQVESFATLRMPGVHIETRPVREDIGAEVVGLLAGRVDAESDGQFGAEHTFDEALTGVDGALRYRRDAAGRPLWLEAGAYTPPERGRDVRLAIDLYLQDMAQEAVERAVADADAAGGRLVLLDTETGETLALVDVIRDMRGKVVPWGEKPRAGGPSRRAVVPPDPNRDIHPGAGRNRCVTDVFEPGSTFKPFVWSVITADGLARLDEVFHTEGRERRTSYGRPIRDVTPRDSQTWRQVLVNSSNIGMSMAVERISPSRLRSALVSYGFGAPTGAPIPGEQPGRLTPPRSWSKYTHTSVSFGQEVHVTALQLARAFCAFARDGELAGAVPDVRVLALGERADADASAVRVIPPQAATQARLAMADVMHAADVRMKARGLDVTYHYNLFGKSGTAQVALPGERGYLPNQYISNFIAAGPVEAPRLVCLVVIDDPGPETIRRVEHRGSAVAAPVARRVLEDALAYLGVPASNPEGLEPKDPSKVAGLSR